MSTTDFDAEKDLEIAKRMMVQGRLAATLDGVHLINWGITIVVILLLQYFAEARDWLPSSLLWLWQPLVFAGIVFSLFLGRRSPYRRWNSPASRTYVTAFTATGVSLALYVLFSGLGNRPDQFFLVLLASCLLGTTFFVTSVAIQMPRLQFATVGWWLTFALFCFKGQLVLGDFFILCGAFFLFMILPGFYLRHRRHQLAHEAI